MEFRNKFALVMTIGRPVRYSLRLLRLSSIRSAERMSKYKIDNNTNLLNGMLNNCTTFIALIASVFFTWNLEFRNFVCGKRENTF